MRDIERRSQNPYNHLRKYGFGVALSFLLSVAALTPLRAEADHEESKPLLNDILILDLVNEWRQINELPPFQTSDEICFAARVRAEMFMMDNGRLSREALATRKHPMVEEIRRFYDSDYIAESLAYNFREETSVVKAWKSSPSHNEILLSFHNQGRTPLYACVVSRRDGYPSVTVFLIGER